jgi:hypothetical protein
MHSFATIYHANIQDTSHVFIPDVPVNDTGGGVVGKDAGSVC